jgi:hypothetical protein
MPRQHNDFSAFVLKSSRGFKFLTTVMKNSMYFKCTFQCLTPYTLLFSPYISKIFTINMLDCNVSIVSLQISDKISLKYKG